MSEMLKSLDCQEKQSILESSYHTTIEQGGSLTFLLKDSPDGTHDAQIAEKVTERMQHLTILHSQIQPLVTKNVTIETVNTEKTQIQEDESTGNGDQLTDPPQLQVTGNGDQLTDPPQLQVTEDAFEDDIVFSNESYPTTQDETSETTPIKGHGTSLEEVESITTLVYNMSHYLLEYNYPVSFNRYLRIFQSLLCISCIFTKYFHRNKTK